MGRPHTWVCPYPALPSYRGVGDPTKASSFACDIDRDRDDNRQVRMAHRPEIGISLRQMPLPALIAAAQEIEIKRVFRRLERVRARSRRLKKSRPLYT